MIEITLRGIRHMYSQLVRMERNVHSSSQTLTLEATEWLKRDIRSHWSSRSPSARGSAPAIWTGNLDSSILVEQQGRGIGGRFAGQDAIYHYLKIDTSQGSNPLNRGGYSRVLEEEMDRPFLEPALDRLGQIYPSMARRTIRIL